MSHPAPRLEDAVMTRRELLCRSGMGMGALALGGRAGDAGLLTASARAALWLTATQAARLAGVPASRREPALAQGGAAARRGPSGSFICS